MRDRRLRGADRPGRRADHRRRPCPGGLHRHVGHVVLRDQLPAVLYGSLYAVRRELRGGAACSRTTPARWTRCGSPRRKAPSSMRTHPAAVYARSVMGHMLPDVVYRLPRPGAAGTRAGRRHVQSLDAQPDRRARPDRHRRAARHAVHGEQLPFRRRGRAAAAGRPVGDAVPVRRAQRAGRGDRGDHAAGDLAQGDCARIPAAPGGSAAGWAR